VDVERRFIAPAHAQLRLAGGANDAATGALVGYAAVFDSLSEDLGRFRERLMPGAFARVLRERPDVVALWNHDMNFVLGRTTNASLELAEDKHGLRALIRPPDTATAREVRTLVAGGFVTGMSFAFMLDPAGFTFRDTPDGAIREVHEIAMLIDVSVVTTPAFRDTSVVARARGAAAGRATDRLRRRLLIS
jgi:Escherichia/Staphylococcus phage prohead protease